MPYHHGQLREALIEAAVALAREEGPEAVGLRAVTRLTHVSHNAAYRHFADRADLLRAVCEQCMTRFAWLIEARIDAVTSGGDPVEEAWARLLATGRAYVEFALTERGWFRTAFAIPGSLAHIEAGEGAGHSGLNPYQLLGAGLDDLVAVGALPAVRRPGAEYAAWAAVHGIATLLSDGPLRELPEGDRQAAIEKVLAVVAAGL